MTSKPPESHPLLSQPISQASPVSEVARRLLSYLSTSALDPGARLPSERDLAARFQVGRSAVREALAALDLLGVVTIRQGSGTYFNTTSTDLLPQVIDWGLLLGQPETMALVEARRHIEVVLSRLAAQRVDSGSAAALQGSLDRMRETAGDRQAFTEADVDFHREVAKIADNSVLAGFHHSVSSLLHVWITRATERPGQVEVTLIEHTAVLDAIVAGDADEAAAAMERHMENASGRLQESLQADIEAESEATISAAMDQP
jgi:GntR family transcriptional regulator, transcriptional repressor for pyruvate dehydrogenase complex